MRLAIVLCSGVVLLRFAGRARLGARVRALAGVRLRTVDRLAAFVARVRPERLIAAALGGYVAAGPVVAGIAAGATLGADRFSRARAERKRRAAMDAQLPDVLRAIASAMRAGRSLPQAIDAAREQARQPIRAPLEAAVARLGVGAAVDDAIEAFARTAATDAARSAAETLRIGRTAGANLPGVLDIAVTSLAERARLDGERRAATAQARLSGIVVGAMPVAFFVMAGSAARQQLRFLIGEPLGWVLLGLGAMLEAGGALWMRALLR